MVSRNDVGADRLFRSVLRQQGRPPAAGTFQHLWLGDEPLGCVQRRSTSAGIRRKRREFRASPASKPKPRAKRFEPNQRPGSRSEENGDRLPEPSDRRLRTADRGAKNSSGKDRERLRRPLDRAARRSLISGERADALVPEHSLGSPDKIRLLKKRPARYDEGSFLRLRFFPHLFGPPVPCRAL